MFFTVWNILQTSPDGNVTLSILNYVPSIRDAGKYIACRAENSELPDATLEDGWKLEIHCKFLSENYLRVRVISNIRYIVANLIHSI